VRECKEAVVTLRFWGRISHRNPASEDVSRKVPAKVSRLALDGTSVRTLISIVLHPVTPLAPWTGSSKSPAYSASIASREVRRGDAIGVPGRPLHQLDPVAVRVGEPARPEIVGTVR
jgi:hypothetical protein